MAGKIERYEDCYASEYLAPEDLPEGQEFDVTFVSWEARKVFCKGKHSMKCTVSAVRDGKPCKKRICLNKTSAKALRRAWGDKFDDWMNKPVTVRRGMVNNKLATIITPKGVEAEIES